MIDKPRLVLMQGKIELMSVALIVTEQVTMQEIVVLDVKTETDTLDQDLDLGRLVVGIETTVDRNQGIVIGIVVIVRTGGRQPDIAGTAVTDVIGSTVAGRALLYTSVIEMRETILHVVSRVDYLI
jgi:hypothetical protein